MEKRMPNSGEIGVNNGKLNGYWASDKLIIYWTSQVMKATIDAYGDANHRS
jgi:hypothetical protein